MTAAETWVPIPGFDDAYEVSNRGRVRSLDRVRRCGCGQRLWRGCILRPIIDRDGYEQVGLSYAGRTATRKVHRLTAQGFIPNPDSLPEVNHLDLDRRNNAVSNLEWTTRIDNHLHSLAHGRHHAATNPNKVRKLTPASVADIRLRAAGGEAQRVIAADFGVSRGTVRSVVIGKSWRRRA
jgi:hypothetical protein